MNKYVYEISLSAEERGTLAWLVDHGYFPKELYDGMIRIGDEPEEDDEGYLRDQQELYGIPEHAAWYLITLREDYPDAYLSCLDPRSDLYDKIIKLENQIV